MLFTARTAAAEAIEMTHCTRRGGCTELEAQLEEAAGVQLLLLLLMVVVLLVVVVLVVVMLMQRRRRMRIQIEMPAQHAGRRARRGGAGRLQRQAAVAAGAGRQLRAAAARLLRLQMLGVGMLQLIAGME